MKCLHPIWIPHRGYVPCGKCVACLQNRQKDWAFRLIEDNRLAKCSYFVTLTYEDEHLTFDETGTFPIVVKRDLQLFNKRLRKRLDALGYKVRYFLAAEYGPTTLRPHYHGIYLFDEIIPQEVFAQAVKEAWNLGFITMAPVSTTRCFYVAKYCCSFSFLPEHLQDDKCKPFLLCSKKIGIGSKYVNGTEARNLRLNPKPAVRRENGHYVSIPRYLRDKVFDDDMRAELSSLSYDHALAERSKRMERDKVFLLKNGLERYLSYGHEQVENYEQIIQKRIKAKGKL